MLLGVTRCLGVAGLHNYDAKLRIQSCQLVFLKTTGWAKSQYPYVEPYTTAVFYI